VPRPLDPGSAVAPRAAGASHEAGIPAPAAIESGTAPPGRSAAPDPVVELALRPGSPVRIGPQTTAWAALLSCGHYLPIGRARGVLAALAGIGVSSGFIAGVRGRAAALLNTEFLPHLRALLPTAGVLHADETTGRAAGTLAYVPVACTEYLTLMHVGGRSSDDIDAGGVLPEFTGTLLRDGYAGYAHLPAVPAWCAAHLLRDLRALSDADPAGQRWAQAMADTLLDAHQAAHQARAVGVDHLDPVVLTQIRNYYQGALAKGTTDNRDQRSTLAAQARRLVQRFTPLRRPNPALRGRSHGAVHEQLRATSNPTSQGATTHLRRLLAHPTRTHRLRARALLPRHHHQVGHQQALRTTTALHHRPLAPTNPHTS
jgi:hypothetical protein